MGANMDFNEYWSIFLAYDGPRYTAWLLLILFLAGCAMRTLALLNSAEKFRDPEAAIVEAEKSIRGARRPVKKLLRANYKTAIAAVERYQDRLSEEKLSRSSAAWEEWRKIANDASELLMVAAVAPAASLLFYLNQYHIFWPDALSTPLSIWDGTILRVASAQEIIEFIVWQMANVLNFTQTWINAGECNINGKIYIADAIKTETVGFRLMLWYGGATAIDFFRRSIQFGLIGVLRVANQAFRNVKDEINMAPDELLQKLKKEYLEE